MSAFAAITGAVAAEANHSPWPRYRVDAAAWLAAGEWLRDGTCALCGYWAEADRVHLALSDPGMADLCVLSLDCPTGVFPSISALFAPAGRLERTIGDLYGLRADGAPDTRPWLDHGCWPATSRASGSDSGAATAESPPPYAFLPVEGESLHQIPVGPVHAGIIEPGHFRFTAGGETVVRLEARLGYVHKGIESLMAGAPLAKAARLAGRISGDSTVTYAIAFARAVEAASGAPVPDRAHWLRALMAELERIANHLGDIGAICNDAAFARMLAPCAVLRELVLRTAKRCFGHRLMMDRVIPGGVAVDLQDEGKTAVRALVAKIRRRLPGLIALYDNTTSLQDRTVATGILRADFARRFGCGGVIARASGRDVDARRRPGYPPYDQISFTVPVLEKGDVNARVWVRIREVEQSLSLITQMLARMPQGPVATEVGADDPSGPREGMALVEGFRGDVLVWVKLRPDGTVERCHPRDPSWFQWPLLEAAIEGNIVADFPLCNKSFNCSYSGPDL
ncbi:MAG: NADH-quinone oxidoreductase subunit C [Rhodospirillales bacterium]